MTRERLYGETGQQLMVETAPPFETFFWPEHILNNFTIPFDQ